MTAKPKRKASRQRPQKSARWRTRDVGPKPTVVIVGFGRLGGALALRLKQAGWPVSVLPRSTDAVKRAFQFGLRLADHDDLTAADLCVLAVPDAAVPPLAQRIEEDLGKDTALVHCAGALDLNALAQSPSTQRRLRGSFHPLVAISDPRDLLEGHSVAVATSDRTLMPLLWRMALALRLKPIEVPEARRAAYHAGAVLSAGLVVGLLDAAVAAIAEAGINPDDGLQALLPLTRSALRGVEQRGLAKGLTGPLARGDVDVVKAHLAALPPPLASLYRQLSRRALALVADRMPQETRFALERLLE